MTLDVMANSLVYWTQDLFFAELLAPGARIFAMTSAGDHIVWPAYGAVSAAKSALESHVRQLAVELAPNRMSVNALRAGVTDTPALRKIPGNEAMIERITAMHPAGRLTGPEDVAGALVALCDEGGLGHRQRDRRRRRRRHRGRQVGVSAGAFEFLKEKAGFREWRLQSNGLRVLLLSNCVAPVVTFAVVYHVGSRNEAVGYTGATHLLEHLMFKGTPEYDRAKGTAIAAVLEAIGARFNATTWFDRTNYYETIPSDQLEIALAIEASRMRGSLLRDEDRVPEMTVVRNEFERGENSPFQVLYKHTFATAFREHPYHHPTIGWRSDIEGVSTERLQEFYDAFYHPNNATAMLIGDFEEDDALARDRAALRRVAGLAASDSGDLHRRAAAGRRAPVRGAARRSGRLVRALLAHRRGAARRHAGARDPRQHPGRRYHGRLHQALVEKSLALSVTVVAWQLRDPALFSVFAPVRPGVESVASSRR